MGTCFDCDKVIQRHPMDDAMDCFCQRCPDCNEVIYDGAPVGSPCEECDPELADDYDLRPV